MKRLLLATSIALAAVAPLAPSAHADGGDDAKGPDCAEIVDGRGSYQFGPTPGTRIVTSTMTMLAPACPEVTYTFEVTYTTLGGTQARVVTTDYVATGNLVDFTVEVPEADAPETVQATVTTSKRNKAYDDTFTAISFDILGNGGGGSYQG